MMSKSLPTNCMARKHRNTGLSLPRMTRKDQDTRSILGRMVGTSVSFNGLVVPASTLPATLSRYVDNLFVWNDHQAYKVSLVGSAVPIHFFGRYFLLCTNHQLRGCQLDRVSLLGRDGINLVTSSGVRPRCCFGATPLVGELPRSNGQTHCLAISALAR
jgi:hypothetical protein